MDDLGIVFAASGTTDWITAIGTALGGGAAAIALWVGYHQWKRGGFIYRIRASIDQDRRVVLVSILNTGRMSGQITYIEILNRRSLKTRLDLMLRGQRGAYEAIDAEMWPVAPGSRITTIAASPVATGDVSVELPAGHSFGAHVVRDGGSADRNDHPPFVPDAAEKSRWLQVRVGFGDGRVAEAVPGEIIGEYRLRAARGRPRTDP